jgi:Tfp pilus assembly protein PilN
MKQHLQHGLTDEEFVHRSYQRILGLWNRLDLRRLAGRKKLLGLQITEARARVALVERKGLSLDRLAMGFIVRKTGECTFPSGCSLQAQGEILKKTLEQLGSETSAAVTILGSRMRQAVAPIPSDVEDIPQWIEANKEDLLKLPIRDVVATWEIRNSEADGKNLEITFMRENEVEETLRVITSSGLSPVSIRLGVGEALLTHIAEHHGSFSAATPLYLFAEGRVWQFSIEDGVPRCVEVPSVNLSEQGEAVRVFGDIPNVELPPRVEVAHPFGANPEFTLAIGAAIRAFLMGGEGSIPQALQSIRRSDEKLLSAITKRTALAFGTALLAVLLASQTGELIVQKERSSLADANESLSAERANLQKIRRRVKSLEAREGKMTGSLRTAPAKALHDLSLMLPPGVILNSLTLDRKPGETLMLVIKGSSLDQLVVTGMLRRMNEDPSWKDARLIETSLRERSYLAVSSREMDAFKYQFTIEAQRQSADR